MAGGSRNDRVSINSKRHHITVVVIGVLADQIYSPGSAKITRLGLKPFLKFLTQDVQPFFHSTGSISARNSGAFNSGSVSLMNIPAPASLPARYFSFSAVRSGG